MKRGASSKVLSLMASVVALMLTGYRQRPRVFALLCSCQSFQVARGKCSAACPFCLASLRKVCCCLSAMHSHSLLRDQVLTPVLEVSRKAGSGYNPKFVLEQTAKAAAAAHTSGLLQ